MTEQQQKLYDKLLKKVNEYCLGAAAEDVIAAIDALVENYESIHTTLCTIATELGEQVADNVNPKVDPVSEPLQALKQFRNSQYQGVNVYADELLDIIETALNELETLKETQYVFMGPRACGKTFELMYKADIALKLKAVEVIKNKNLLWDIDYQPYKENNDYRAWDNEFYESIELTPEEYSLLKKVFKNESTN